MTAPPNAQPPTPEPSPAERLGGLAVLVLSLAAGLALRLHLALTDDGIYWPDEVYQSLEPAHRLVFGYGMVAWEFVDGARSWAFPFLCAALLKLSELVGLDRPGEYVPFLKSCFALVGAATAYGCYLLARTYGASKLASATGAAMFALAAPAIYFGPRAMSETASALLVVFGLGLSLRRNPRRWELLLGASLLGFSVLLRLQSAVFCAGLLGALLGRRSFKEARDTALVLLGWAVAFGALDHFTWADAPGARFGGWFHSALKYFEFNLIQDRATGWGVGPWYFYFRHLFSSMPALAIGLGLGSAMAGRRAAGLLAIAVAFFALHSWVAHKELRFVIPALPLFCALCAVGLSELPARVSRWAASPSLLLAALWSAASHRSLTFGDLGQYPERPGASAYDDFGPVNRMLLAAHERPDLCGIRVDIAHLAWAGGHTYLHRKVPLYHLGWPPIEARTFNYVITWASHHLPGEVVAKDARNPQVALVRLHLDGCRADVGYPWRLP
ncbi:MAG: hypothetical protein HYZ28_00150 [Myxococcales bacterium]|nr:hypothetical protein [Myxococcales bacterium]